MKHRVKAKHFNRDTKSRQALLKNLLRNLFERGEIKTSETRVKETKRLADKLISKALENTLAARRELHKFFGKRDVVNTLVDKIAPSFGEKKSGFTSIKKLAVRRGDNTEVFKLSLLTGDVKWASLKKEKSVKTEEKTPVKVASKATPKAPAKKAPAKSAAKTADKAVSAKKVATKKPAAKKAKKTEEKK